MLPDQRLDVLRCANNPGLYANAIEILVAGVRAYLPRVGYPVIARAGAGVVEFAPGTKSLFVLSIEAARKYADALHVAADVAESQAETARHARSGPPANEALVDELQRRLACAERERDALQAKLDGLR